MPAGTEGFNLYQRNMDKVALIFKLDDLYDKVAGIKANDYEDILIYINPDKYGSFYLNEEALNKFNNTISKINTISRTIEIDMRDNYATDEKVYGLCEFIANNENIEKLVVLMTSNEITDVGAKKIINAFAKLQNLNFLNISFDWCFEVSNESLKLLCETIKKLPNLRTVKVWITKHTKVNLEGEEMFREAVKTMSNLKHCEFGGKNVLN